MSIPNINRNAVTQTLTASGNINFESDIVSCDCTSGNITATLYSISDGATHQVIVRKTDSSANTVTVTDGTFSFSLSAQNDAVICQTTDAGVWFGLAGFDAQGTGDVEGPASAVSGNLAVFSGTTGKIIADGGITPRPLGMTVVSANSVVTPNASASFAFIECWGGGGGGGGCSGAANSAAGGGGGGAGGYSAKWVSAFAGSTFSIAIGASGAGGTAAGVSGGTGGSTLVSTIISATGGVGGVGMLAVVPPTFALGGAGGASTTGGDVNQAGNPGNFGMAGSGTSAAGGNGGATVNGGRGLGAGGAGTAGGAATPNSGSGGGGAASVGATGRAGGDGGTGLVVITYYR